MVQTKVRTLATTAVVAVSLSAALISQPAGPFKGHADLSPYQEVPTLSTPASGTLDVEISKNGELVAYTLSYEGLSTPIRFAHIHLGRPAINGGVMVFLCNNVTPAPANVPTPPPCPQGSGTVSGELTAADVGAAAAGQGVAANEFAEFVAALRAEAAYGNLHTDAFLGGEIRGQVTFRRKDSKKDN
jgi:CHRD domain